MELLLDENLPKRLEEIFLDHEVYTVRDMGWNGRKDMDLLRLLEEHGFHALLTFDKKTYDISKISENPYHRFYSFRSN